MSDTTEKRMPIQDILDACEARKPHIERLRGNAVKDHVRKQMIGVACTPMSAKRELMRAKIEKAKRDPKVAAQENTIAGKFNAIVFAASYMKDAGAHDMVLDEDLAWEVLGPEWQAKVDAAHSPSFA